MSTPANIIGRAFAAMATSGLSEVPAAGAAVLSKKPLSAYKESWSPSDAPTPATPEVSPATSPASLATGPLSSLQRRRLFSTLVTNPYGLVADPSVVRKTTLLGSDAFNPTLGR